MRKIFKILTTSIISTMGVLPMATSLTSCSKQYQYQGKLTDYLHEITYDDYREDTKWETIDEGRDLPSSFGCSSVRKGNFYGRNFDYVYNDTPEFIVHVKAKEGRHASLAVATHFGLRENKLLAGKYNKELELIPNLTMDGINDAGVICSANVVSMEPAKVGETEYVPETNPGKKNVHCLFAVRYVLDNADSALDGVNKLKNDVNIVGNLNNKNFLHIMIADKNETYVVEFFHLPTSNHNHFDVISEKKEENSTTEDGLPIMTNYYVNLHSHSDAFTNDEKNGQERYEVLKKHYDEATDMKGMYKLMQYVTFSKAYGDHEIDKPWLLDQTQDPGLCEWYSEAIKLSLLKDWKENPEDWSPELKAAMNNLQELKEGYITRVREEANPKYWITTHNSTYDINNKKLRITVQEQYTWYKEFSLQ